MNRIIEWSIAGAIIIASGVGFFYWNHYESEVSSDMQTTVDVYLAGKLLGMYAQQYAAYPPSDDPFVKKLLSPRVSYTALLQDGIAECADQPRCPSYSLSFILKTNSLFPNGKHSASPDGIK